MTEHAIIEIRHLRKGYTNVVPLKDVSASVYKGDVISIIGPSGTGKSTLLRCINLLERPDAGQIFIDGEEITAKRCRLDLVRRKMGMVFQSFNLFNHLNVLDNITYAPMKVLGLSRKDAEARGMKLLRAVSLSEKAHNYPDELSGGQKQRIAIARTLAMEPDIILLDEPTSALDPTMVDEVQAVIMELAKKGMTMLIVTHEMNFARRVSNRVFYMDDGGIYEDGSPDQIFDHPQKERTRQFMHRLKVLRESGTVASLDFLGFIGRIEAFAHKNRMGPKTAYHVHSILEEILQVTVLPALSPDTQLEIMLEYSEKEDSGRLVLTFGGPELDPMRRTDDLSGKLLDAFTKDYSYAYKDGMNRAEFRYV